MTTNRFNFRTFTSLMITWSFLVLILSGSILYIAPPGRIANWSIWRFLILTKTQWQSLHTLAALTFMIGGLFHLLKFNWKTFVAYMAKKGESGWRYRNELAASIVFSIIVLGGTLYELQPFAYVVASGDALKNSWSTPAAEPPIPHLEAADMNKLAEQFKVSVATLTATLKENAMPVTGPEQTLTELSKAYGRTPQEIYSVLKQSAPQNPGEISHTAPGENVPAGSGAGLGSKTVAQTAADLGMSTETVLERLQKHNIKAMAQDTIRTAATKGNIKPYELVELLKSGTTD